MGTFAGTSGKAFAAPDADGKISGTIGDAPAAAVPFVVGPGLEALPEDPATGEPGQYQLMLDGPVVGSEADREAVRSFVDAYPQVKGQVVEMMKAGLTWSEILVSLQLFQAFLTGVLTTPPGGTFDTPSAQLTLPAAAGGGVWAVSLHGVRKA